jgi:hypothetical protein
VDDGLSILQYTDDIILFMEHDLNHAKNLKPLASNFWNVGISESIVASKLDFGNTFGLEINHCE